MFRTKIQTTALACVIVLLAGGCATKAPPSNDDVRKQALTNVNLDHPWKATTATATSDAVQDNWLSTFNDPMLDALVKEAIANNADLRVAAARVEQAKAYLDSAQSKLRPSIAIAGTGGAK